MPILMDPIDVLPDLDGTESVLVVPCRFCPAASMAVRNGEPYIEFPRRALKTASYERLVRAMRERMEHRGIRVGVFKSRLLHQFVLCMWSSRRRRKLARLARNYEAVVVIGCEAAVDTVREALKANSCKVVSAMKTEGIMSIQPTFRLPCNISLELDGVTPILHPSS